MFTNPLILTLLIEGTVLLLLKTKDPLFYLYWAALTTLTNLPANIYLSLSSFDSNTTFYLAVAIIEILVFISELLLCFLYTKDLKSSVKYGALCNLSSFIIGTVIIMII